MLKIDILTLFPKMFEGPISESLIGKARNKGLIDICVRDLRSYSSEKHGKVDDKEFGGGPGMLIQVEPIYRAVKEIASAKRSKTKPCVVYLSPQGKKLNQKLALDLSKKKHLILLCGHYEGIDERAMEWVDEEISIGDYVLTGGEIPAMVLTDAVARLVPGVVKEWDSIENDSFFKNSLDYPHYTRPQKFLNYEVPSVLLSGNHKEIAKWRNESSQKRTLEKRPDLMKEEVLH